jgi:HEAT repeat protein
MRGMRAWGILLLCAVASAGEDRGSATEVIAAMREYYALLRTPGNGNIESIRNRLIANVSGVSAKTQKSVRSQIDKGFDGKYGKDAAFHKCLAEILAAQGKPGLNTLYKRYKKMRRSTGTRVAIAEALGACKDKQALDLLLKICHDKEADVAAAAIAGMCNYVPESVKSKRFVMRTFVDIYIKVTATAQGKERDSDERKAYDTLKPVLDKTLDLYSGGEKLDSAQAWDAWLRAQATES